MIRSTWLAWGLGVAGVCVMQAPAHAVDVETVTGHYRLTASDSGCQGMAPSELDMLDVDGHLTVLAFGDRKSVV